MAKNKHRKVVTARRKAIASTLCGQPSLVGLRPSKDKDILHAYSTHCCVPKKVDNPYITINKKGETELEYTQEGLTLYREIKAKWKKWNKRFYPDVGVYKRGRLLYSKNRRSPWYMATKGKQYRYASKTYNWGMMSSWIRVKSELGVFHSKSIVSKMTRVKYNDLLIEAKLKDWEKEHPCPIPKDPEQPDLFEVQFMVPWKAKRKAARMKIVNFVDNIRNRATVYARYEGDKGYPHKIATIKSDHKPFMIMDGKYNNYACQTVNRAQSLANKLKNNNKKLIALKVVEPSQQCIVVPHTPIEERLAA